MAIPTTYIARNLWVRRVTTLLTASGLALVVFVFTTVLMLDEGLKRTLVTTGEYNNVVAIRKGSETEVQSGIYRTQANIIETHPSVSLDSDGKKLSSQELVILISLKKMGKDKPSNVVIRGTSEKGLIIRPQIKIAQGRMFRPGTSEILIGSAIERGYADTQIGSILRFAQKDWDIVGVFDAANSGFDSEIWGDADQLMQAFRRKTFSSMVFRVKEGTSIQKLRKDFDADPRLYQEIKRERNFYMDQSRALSKFIRILGFTLTIIFSIGAIIGATITMYASVANRTGEIGTLRALGFRRNEVLVAFLFESLLISLTGGTIGVASASLMQFASFSTTNFETFADLSFGFIMTETILAKGLVFSLLMGIVGGTFPALRASKLNIVDALRMS